MARIVIEALARFALRFTILAYRALLSPFLGGACRYLPSCSHYAEEALALHGPWRGTRLSLARLLRCHPWGGAGHDPVPAREVAAHRPSGGRLHSRDSLPQGKCPR